MDIQEIIDISHKGLIDAPDRDRLASLVEYLVEGNEPEDLALLYLEALGEEGRNDLWKEAYEE